MTITFTAMDDPQQRDISQAGSEDRRDQDTDYSAFGEKGGKATQDSNTEELGDQDGSVGSLHSHKDG